MKRAFTMLELIFVIVIIGIIAGVAVPKLSDAREKAEAAKIAANLRILLSDLQQYRILKGHFPTNNGFPDITKVSGAFDWSSKTNGTKARSGEKAHPRRSDDQLANYYGIKVGNKECLKVAVVDLEAANSYLYNGFKGFPMDGGRCYFFTSDLLPSTKQKFSYLLVEQGGDKDDPACFAVIKDPNIKKMIDSTFSFTYKKLDERYCNWFETDQVETTTLDGIPILLP